jgi:hypothetical protein
MGEGDKGDKGGMYYRLKKLPEGEGGRGRRSQKRRRGTIFEPIPCRRSWIPLQELMGTGDRAGDRKCRTPRPVEPSVAPPYRGGGGVRGSRAESGPTSGGAGAGGRPGEGGAARSMAAFSREKLPTDPWVWGAVLGLLGRKVRGLG